MCFFVQVKHHKMIDMTNNWKGFNWPDMGLHPGLVSAIGTRSLDSLPWHRDGQNPMPGGIIYLITNFPLKEVLGVNGVLGPRARVQSFNLEPLARADPGPLSL